MKRSRKRPHRLLIVDDSRMMRKGLKKIFQDIAEIEVTGEAEHGAQALELIPELKPDVVTLDINMPVMDGITTLKHMMIKSPKPTVMCSTLTKEGADITFDALKYGAVDFIHKPSKASDLSLDIQHQEIVRKVLMAAQVNMKHVHRLLPNINNVATSENSSDNKLKKLLAIGASEGGYSSLLNILPHLEPTIPAAYIVVLYCSPQNTEAFINYLNKHCTIKIARAENSVAIQPGHCYIASENDYVSVEKKESDYILNVHQTPFKDKRRAINMLMLSIADCIQENAVGVILSGNGQDGSEGLEEINRAGGKSIIQQPDTCLFREMPSTAAENCTSPLLSTDKEMASVICTAVM